LVCDLLSLLLDNAGCGSWQIESATRTLALILTVVDILHEAGLVTVGLCLVFLLLLGQAISLLLCFALLLGEAFLSVLLGLLGVLGGTLCILAVLLSLAFSVLFGLALLLSLLIGNLLGETLSFLSLLALGTFLLFLQLLSFLFLLSLLLLFFLKHLVLEQLAGIGLLSLLLKLRKSILLLLLRAREVGSQQGFLLSEALLLLFLFFGDALSLLLLVGLARLLALLGLPGLLLGLVLLALPQNRSGLLLKLLALQLLLLQAECVDHLLLLERLGFLLLLQLELALGAFLSLLAGETLSVDLLGPLRSDFLLLLGGLLHHLAQSLFLFLLLFDDLEVGVLIRSLIWVDFLVILKVNLVVVLVFTTATAGALSGMQLINFILTSHKVTVLSVKCALELHTSSISLNILILAL